MVDARPVVSLYQAFEDALWRRTFVDEMDEPLFLKFYEWAGAEKPAGLYAIIDDRNSRWFDDITTVEKQESRDDIFLLAIRDAEERLQSDFGGESRRGWDRVHAARFSHALGGIGFPFRWFLNRGPVPVEGDGTTVMRISWNRLTPFAAWELSIVAAALRRRAMGRRPRRDAGRAVGPPDEPVLFRSERDLADRQVSHAAVLPRRCPGSVKASAAAGSVTGLGLGAWDLGLAQPQARSDLLRFTIASGDTIAEFLNSVRLNFLEQRQSFRQAHQVESLARRSQRDIKKTQVVRL